MSKLGRLYYTLTEEIKMPKEYIMKLTSDHLLFLEKLFHILDEDMYPYNDNILFYFNDSSVTVEVYQKWNKYTYIINYADFLHGISPKDVIKNKLRSIDIRPMENEKEDR